MVMTTWVTEVAQNSETWQIPFHGETLKCQEGLNATESLPLSIQKIYHLHVRNEVLAVETARRAMR